MMQSVGFDSVTMIVGNEATNKSQRGIDRDPSATVIANFAMNSLQFGPFVVPVA
jgi:hypothetical protein